MTRMESIDIPTASYTEQSQQWPQSGRHILAHFDDETIIVYQAYRPEIGHFAAEHGYFGGEFTYTRMSWIKPNFLWMMYRSDWGQSKGQEVILAVRGFHAPDPARSEAPFDRVGGGYLWIKIGNTLVEY